MAAHSGFPVGDEGITRSGRKAHSHECWQATFLHRPVDRCLSALSRMCIRDTDQHTVPGTFQACGTGGGTQCAYLWVCVFDADAGCAGNKAMLFKRYADCQQRESDE